MKEPAEEWITIAEAARRLNAPERSVRRLVTSPEYADRTRHEERKTRTGIRAAVLLPAALLAEIGQHFERWETRSEHGNKNTAGIRQNTDSAPNVIRAEHGALIQAYERVMQEQAARIADLQAALVHEREQARKLADALAREQTLRAIMPANSEAAAPDQEPETTTERDAGKDGVSSARDAAAGPSAGNVEAATRPWWKVWQR